MQIETVLLIILAAIVALAIVLLQYFYKAKQKGKLTLLLSFLRCIGIFGLLLLLINPKLTKTTYTVEKATLAVLVDNSSSVQEEEAVLRRILNGLQESSALSNRFEVDYYSFGPELNALDSISFDEKQTNISKSLNLLASTYLNRKAAVLLISDGNQTIGQDYIFTSSKKSPSVFTMTVGDTTAYEDLNIGPINTNTYAFLNNKYPIETYISYQGKENTTSIVRISVNGKSVYKESIKLSETENLQPINTLINADAIGLKTIKVEVDPLATERNTRNNIRETSVEVIDEKTTVGLFSDILHPDIGALKKAIESNEQRVVNILKPSTDISILEEIDVFILYQPNPSFRNILKFIEQKKSNAFIITGTNTDFNFLNAVQSEFEIESGYPQQEVFGKLNKGFSKFDIVNFDLTDFPPLTSDAGPVLLATSGETLLNMEIKGLEMETPLLSLWETNSMKKGLLLGEGIWKWRIQSYRNSGDFSNFDEFIGKAMRYLATSEGKDRLNVDYNKRYEGIGEAYVTATYFDEAYIFDRNAVLEIAVTNNESKQTQNIPMVLKNGYFEADLTNLIPGEYSFRVSVVGESFSEIGNFIISDFDIEKQFVSSNYKKMVQLASKTGGAHYFASEWEALINQLISDEEYLPTQKGTKNVVSLIDFKILLILIVLAFAAEWFIRKFNGLI